MRYKVTSGMIAYIYSTKEEARHTAEMWAYDFIVKNGLDINNMVSDEEVVSVHEGKKHFQATITVVK